MAKQLVVEVKMSYETDHVSDEDWKTLDQKYVALCWLIDTLNYINDTGEISEAGFIVIYWEETDD